MSERHRDLIEGKITVDEYVTMIKREVDMRYADFAADDLPPEQEAEHREVVRQVMADNGTPLSTWTPKRGKLRRLIRRFRSKH